MPQYFYPKIIFIYLCNKRALTLAIFIFFTYKLHTFLLIIFQNQLIFSIYSFTHLFILLLKATMACSKMIIALMLAFVAGSAFAQAPGASPAASPKSSPVPVASPPVATPPSTTSTPPVSAPANAPTTASSPSDSPPAPPTAETPASSPSGAASPPSIAAAPGGSPTESPNSVALNRVSVAGSAVAAVFAAASML